MGKYRHPVFASGARKSAGVRTKKFSEHFLIDHLSFADRKSDII